MKSDLHPSDLGQVMLSALSPVYHEAGEPFLSLIHFLLTKGLEEERDG